jgi:hypothetical protein
MVLVGSKRASPLQQMLLVVVRNMTAITVHEVAALIATASSMDAKTTEKEEEAMDTAKIAVMTHI